MKIEWLDANVTPVGFPDRTEPDILGVIFGICWPIQATFVDGKPFCAVGTPS